MKKFFIGLVCAVLVIGAGMYLFRAPLKEAAMERITADMFVAADTDAYDPGVAIGTTLPALRALFGGREVSGVEEFMGRRGLVLVVNRSVDW
jgi:hypothetical protein